LTANMNYEVSTWNQIYEMLLNQAQKIKSQNYNPDIIVGIIRGGLVPARILTDLLENQQITTIQTEFYLGLNQNSFGRRHRRQRQNPTSSAKSPKTTKSIRNKNRYPLLETANSNGTRFLGKTDRPLGGVSLGVQRDSEKNPSAK
jgi:hypothetical protein